LVDLPAAASFGEPSALVLGKHALNLNQQRVLRICRRSALQEHDVNTVGRELFEQQYLIGVASGQSIRAIDVEPIDASFRDAIA
jgi:hypothetical protein